MEEKVAATLPDQTSLVAKSLSQVEGTNKVAGPYWGKKGRHHYQAGGGNGQEEAERQVT